MNRTYEEKEKLQAKVSKVIFELSQEGAIVAGRTEISTIAFLGIGLCRDEIKRWDSPQAAVSLLRAAAKAVGLWEGFNLSPPIKGIESFLGRRAAHARHEDDRKKAESIKAWYRQSRDTHRSMDAAAETVAAIMGVAFRTARKHIGEEAKIIKMGKA